ncbi:hypothetical protein [Roseibium album]|uniref:hypothetical protein n=1 Tax=Roseibium album TaxID=311410 RepID=UPI002490330F|nr:hypothetical protein [Roseibium album]
MKTHTFAKELISLGEALLLGPNLDTSELRSIGSVLGSNNKGNEEMAIGITTLAELSKHSKNEWVQFIEFHQLPIKYSERDSSRNIMGKIMSYLASDEEAVQRVRRRVVHGSGSSSRLDNAFNLLLKVSGT